MLHQDLNNYNSIRIAGVVRESIVDGPGFRFVVFCQGCPHGCPGCHNPATHDFEGGYDCEIEKILAAVEANPLLDGVTFSGGEPFCQPEAFYSLGVRLKEQNPNLNLLAYTGYTYEELISMEDESINNLLSILDLLVDGRYVQEERDLTLLFRGSQNQRVIDMALTREKKEVILAEKYL